MRNLWLFAVAVAVAGAASARADVVIGYAAPPATAPMAVGPAACGAAGCDAACGKECRPSLRDRLRGLGSRSSCEASGCSTAACSTAQPCAAECAPARCPKEKGCGKGRWERFKAWLCYQPARGCCNRPVCGCKPAPLYTYFLDDCAQGPGCAQPPACCEKPGLWQRLCGSGHKQFASPAGHGCGAGTGCANGGCSVR